MQRFEAVRSGARSRPALLGLLCLILAAPVEASEPGRHLRLDVLVVVYTQTFAATTSAEEVRGIAARVDEVVKSYWDGSGRRLRLAVDTLTIDRFVAEEQFEWYPPEQYWLSHGAHDGVSGVERDLLERGVALDSYDAVAVFYAWKDRPGHRRRFGGATLSVGSVLGKAAYLAIPLAPSLDRVGSIFEHEMLHVLESIFERCGYPDFPVVHNQDFFELVYGTQISWVPWVLGSVPDESYLELDGIWGTVVASGGEGRDGEP